MTTLIDPRNESQPEHASPADRLPSFDGKKIALLDISKPGGSVLLRELETLLQSRFSDLQIQHFRKPTFARPAPDSVIDKIREWRADAAIEALAD